MTEKRPAADPVPLSRSVPSRSPPARDLWWLVPGFGLWFSALVFVYALHHIGCAFGWSAGAIRLSLVVALVVHLAAIGLLWWLAARNGPNPSYGPTGRFLHWIIVGTLVAAIVKIVFTLGPSLFLTACL